jgi:5,5'-dehydrodivanillate O-demethylase oxygenase subunit
MISREENDAMTMVGPGTPAGELLRRYWHPVAVAGELTPEKPLMAVKLLGENLVVFRQPPAPGETKPRFGLVKEKCPHRAASLAYGRVDDEGIRCPYHGWKFDRTGKCLELPAEPAGTPLFNKIRQPAYPVENVAGLLYAYMGPLPAPLVPNWDVLAREDGRRWTVIESVIDCNWLQAMENSLDPAHLYWLHGMFEAKGHISDHSKPYDEKHDFIRFDYGIIKKRTTPGRKPGEAPLVDEHPVLFPSVLRHVAKMKDGPDGAKRLRHNLQIRVPRDDTHTQVYRVNFVPSNSDRSPLDVDPPFEYRPLKHPNGEYDMTIVGAQDSMAWETQGGRYDRSEENLGVSDVGIAMFRRLLKEQIEIVRNGGEPMGVIRDAAKNINIDLGVINDRIGLHRPKALAE